MMAASTAATAGDGFVAAADGELAVGRTMTIGSNHVKRMLMLRRDAAPSASPDDEPDKRMPTYVQLGSSSSALSTSSSSSLPSCSVLFSSPSPSHFPDDESDREPSEPCNLLVSLPEDLLAHIVALMDVDAMGRLRALHALARVNATLHVMLRDQLSLVTNEAAAELVRAHHKGGTDTLLNLSSSSIGRLECELLRLAMRRGIIPNHVTTLWLQCNVIDARGLRSLARGLLEMPDDARLSSMSLGENAFSPAFLGEVPRPEALARALEKLSRAAGRRRVTLRLKS